MKHRVKFLVISFLVFMIFFSIALYVGADAEICNIYTNEKSDECGPLCHGDIAGPDHYPARGWNSLPEELQEEKCRELESVNNAWSWSDSYCLYNDKVDFEGFCSALGYKFVESVPTLAGNDIYVFYYYNRQTVDILFVIGIILLVIGMIIGVWRIVRRYSRGFLGVFFLLRENLAKLVNMVDWKDFFNAKSLIFWISLIFAIIMIIPTLPLAIVPALSGYNPGIDPPFYYLLLIPPFLYLPLALLFPSDIQVDNPWFILILILLFFVYFFLLAFISLKLIKKIWPYINSKELLRPTMGKVIVYLLVLFVIGVPATIYTCPRHDLIENLEHVGPNPCTERFGFSSIIFSGKGLDATTFSRPGYNINIIVPYLIVLYLIVSIVIIVINRLFKKSDSVA